MSRPGGEAKSEETRDQSQTDATAGGRSLGSLRALASLREAARGAADKVRRFSLVQLWGLWLLALLLFLWILFRDWLL